MKKILLTILLVAVGLSVFSQPATRILNMRPAYPLAVGETTVDSLVYIHNGLILQDIVQDSLPIYEIGHIFTQTVRYTEEGHGFYIKADSLHSNQVTYSYQTDTLPRGLIEFNSTTGRFIYYPLASDYQSFVVKFIAACPTDTVWEDVVFDLRPIVVPESFAFQSQGTMPDGMDYITIAETSTFMFLNNENRTAYSYSISGKDIVFDNAIHNKVWGLSGREDIYEMNLYAERLIIRSEIAFPQTNLTIYAKEIIFEDQGGETASINVTPIPFNALTNGQGSNGANAGNISLYAKEIRGNMGKRLILNGEKGQSSNRNGVPGNGGNGGTVTSNIDILNYCDFARGSGGVKLDVASDGSTEAGDIIGAGTMGISGHFEYLDEPYAYLHPYYISAVLRYVNDAFINNYTDYVFQTCKTHKEEIDEYLNALDCDTCYTENEIEFQNELVEIHSILFKIEQGLDYFGNPAGWVPLLSFEVMLANYDNEIDRAIPTLYMYYWLSRIDNSLQQRVAAAQVSTSIVEQELTNNEALINTLVLEIPILENKAIEITEMIDSVKLKIEILRDQLMAKARHNVKKKNHILKGVAICKAVANVLPVFGPVVGTAISTVINTILSDNITSDVLSHLAGVEIDYSSTIKSIGSASCDTNFFSTLSSALSDAKNGLGGGGGFDALKSAYKSASSAIKPLYTTITNVSKLLSTSSAPANEVEAEFNKLAAESAEWKSLEAAFNELNQKKNELLLRVNQNLMNMTSTLAEVSNDVIALDVFRRDAFTGNSKRDLNAMQYLEKMEQRAKNRLLKYHYYLRKAYEYRLLKPYEGEFNLVGMFDRFEALGLTLDSIVDPAAHSSLKSVFREVVSEIAEEIIDEYSNNTPEQSAPITIVIPRDQLDILNEYGALTLNFYEMGIFSPDEENVRIVNLSVEHLGSHVNGNIGYSGYMDLNMTHQGISRFRKNGQIFWFDHISRTTTSPHTWGTRYDAITQTNTPIQPSYASSSLLYSLLNNNNSNMMLFSRPSAWGDINVTKKVHTSGGADIVIDSLVLRLQYDFTTRPTNIRNIDITTNEGLLPYIACSEADRNGRSNGNGNLNRSYNVSNQTVSFTAIEEYGSWHFVNWTDRAGNIVSDTMDLTVNRLTDQFYRANYERRVPILSVPDTIFVNSTSGVYSVPVANIGSGDTEMDWYVSDSSSTWVHLNGLVEGVDDGNFSFLYEENETGSYRLDSLEIFAPETDIMSKMIYIVQTASPGCNLSAFIAPASVTICQGETAIVTASGQSSLGNQFSYNWNTGETTPTINVLGGGERVVTVSDSNGCSATASVNVTVNPLPSVAISGNTTLCVGESSLLTASGGSSYVWNTGATSPSITVSNGAIYSVTATNSYGCSSSASVQVISLENVSISGNLNICHGQSTTLYANGTGSYLWNTGANTSSITVTQAGLYTVTVSLGNCSSSASASVSVAANPVPNISGNTTICQGETSLLIANGGNSYVWSNGSASNSIGVSQSGTYSVTATSMEGCTGSTSVFVTVNPLPNVSISGNNSFCQGDNVTLTATGASNYAWSNATTNAATTVSSAGNYTVTGTDANGCSNTATKAVSVNPTYNVALTHSMCEGESYNFYGQNLITAGTYTHTLQTINGCDSVLTLTLTVKPLPTPSITGNTTLCEGETTTLTANGGIFYAWSNAATANSINVSQSGIYTVTATNAEGCSATANVTVTVNPLPTITIAGNTTLCAGSSTTLTATGADSYVWSTGDNTALVSISAFGVYTVTGTTTAGCSGTANVTVLVSQLPVITITGATDICMGESTTLTANGGETYLWSDGTTNNTLTVSTAGTYQVIGYNAAGCNAMASATVNVWQPAASEFSVECPDSCYTWNAQTYCTSGDYTQTFQTVHGCDSVVTLHLTITVGIDDHDLAGSVKFFPNPANSMLNVQWAIGNEAATIELLDVTGKLLRTFSATGEITSINVSALADGLYFVRVTTSEGTVTKPFVVKR